MRNLVISILTTLDCHCYTCDFKNYFSYVLKTFERKFYIFSFCFNTHLWRVTADGMWLEACKMEHFGNVWSGLVTGGMGWFCCLMNIVNGLTTIKYKVTITSQNVETFLSCLPHAVLCLYSLGLFGFSLPYPLFYCILNRVFARTTEQVERRWMWVIQSVQGDTVCLLSLAVYTVSRFFSFVTTVVWYKNPVYCLLFVRKVYVILLGTVG